MATVLTVVLMMYRDGSVLNRWMMFPLLRTMNVYRGDKGQRSDTWFFFKE